MVRHLSPPVLEALRRRMRMLETPRRRGERATVLPFGDDRVDDCLADGGLPLGRLHEIGGTGIETETGAVTAAFAAGILARLPGRGAILWCGLRRSEEHTAELQFLMRNP